MYTSAMLKAEFSDGSGQYIHHFSQPILAPVLPNTVKTVDVSDIVVTALLSNYFETRRQQLTYLETNTGFMQSAIPAPNNPMRVLPASNITMGTCISSVTDPTHSNTFSMICLTEAILRNRLSEPLRDFEPALYERLQTAPIEQLPQIMMELNNGSEGEGLEISIIKNPKLTITRVTNAEFNLVSDQYRDVPPFFDAFNLIKERIVRQEVSLNSTGFSPAVYTNNGGDGSNDTIVFTGEYAITMTATFPPQPQSPIILT